MCSWSRGVFGCGEQANGLKVAGLVKVAFELECAPNVFWRIVDGRFNGGAGKDEELNGFWLAGIV